ncbi:ABC transporter, permease protein [Aeropyrum pernix]|uniref:ABC transporter, permease protein n=1 Tax=Aeropyrum pernix TaxID=56636 RepID=A0A401HC09_AERPX|nr:ABC transporter permease [Aeropyrum pernix]GBF09953.1 ABC transporter, permease protein [Aeropyrum pernix]
MPRLPVAIGLGDAGLTLAAVALGLAAGAIVLALGGADPLRGVADILLSFIYYPEIFLVRSSILVMTALAFAIPLRMGFFNIGAEGQLYAGAAAALVAALALPHTPLPALVAAAVAGGLMGLFAGLLRVKLNINEVLSTIMLNWIAFWSLRYIVVEYLADPVYSHLTLEVPLEARIPWIPSELLPPPLKEHLRSGFPMIVFVSLVTALTAWAIIYKTVPGLRYRFAGANEYAAASRGVAVERVKLASMAAAGVLAGLGGALLILGHSYRIDSTLSGLFGYGFEGIGVALIGRNNPLGIVAASLFVGDLASGSERIQVTARIPAELADVVNGSIIFTVAALSGLRYTGVPRRLSSIAGRLG